MVEDNNIPPPLPPPDGYVPRAVETVERSALVDGPTCQNCGAAPAAKATFHQNTGMLFSRRVRTIDGTFCRNCGLSLGRTLANRSLWTGWWGLISFVVNIGYMLGNAGTLLRLGTLAKPRDGFGTMDPGRPMLLRSGVLVLAAIVAIGAGGAASSSNTDHTYSNGGYVAPVTPTDVGTSSGLDTGPSSLPNSSWQLGACVSVSGSMAHPVPCTDPHKGTVLMRTVYAANCPPQTDGTVVDGGFTYCVDTG
jgi:hypothetical protein